MKRVFLAIVIALAAGACSSSQTEDKTETAAAEAVEATAAPVKSRVFFKYPEDGAVVSSPVFVEMGIEGMQIEPAGVVKEGFGHHHILLNQESWPVKEVIPMSDTTLHYGKGQTDATLELAPGDYVLTLQFADGVHTSYGPDMASSIKITVK